MFAPLATNHGKARRVARNVPLLYHYVETEDIRFSEIMSLRDVHSVYDDFLGLDGWNRIAIVGMRRDELRRADPAKEVFAKDVTDALSEVKWAPGKAVTVDVVGKAPCLYM